MSKLIAIAIPVVAGKECEFEEFLESLQGEWKEAYETSRRKLNVRERVFVQHSPQGETAIVTIEGDDPEAAFMQFGKGDDAFTHWFAGKVKELHDFDLTQPSQASFPMLVVDSEQMDSAAATLDSRIF